MSYRNVVVLLALAAAAKAQTYGIGTFAGGGVPAGIEATGWGVNAPPKGAATQADAAWKKAGADEGLRQAFERAAYSLEESGHGVYRGVNPAQRLTFEFNGREARLSHPDGSVSFHLTGYGYGDRLAKPARAQLTGTGNRVEYQRGDLTEWYVNGSQGLEQGFTLAHRPGTDRESEPLVIALGVTGGLAPAQKAGDDSVVFESGGSVVLRYAGVTAWDAAGHILPSRLEVRGRQIRLSVEDRGAQYPMVVDPLWTQQQKLTASDGALNDYFGGDVSVSGDTAVIGAYQKNTYQGAAYVFVRNGAGWGQQQKLMASDGVVGDEFGFSVSVSGDTAVIGASDKNGERGAAYVFVRNGAGWSQQQKLTASDGAALDYFGSSVSVSGDTAVIGDAKLSGPGAAYVFVRSGAVWSQQQKLMASDAVNGDDFGYSVSVSADTAVIGAFGGNSLMGAAYVFVRSGAVWSQQQKLAASDGAAYDAFGCSVSVSGDTAVIGAQGKNSDQGAAYVFVRSNGVWSQQQKLTASDGATQDLFGGRVSVSADTAVIGASNASLGAAYVFVRSSGVWSQQQTLTASDLTYGQFGHSVSVSGDTAVIGAPYKNDAQGAAYVFVRPRLGANALLVGSAAGTSSVVLSYNAAWSATANDSFLHIAAGSASGAGSKVVVFTYDAFNGAGTRSGTLTIAGLAVTVTQAGANYIGPGPVITLVSSGLQDPTSVAVDGSGNVYIADSTNRIKKWSAATQQVTTVGPSAGLGYVYPFGVAVDGSGNVYVSDQVANTITEWNGATQEKTTLVSSGLVNPTGVAVDGCGNVYIADTYNNAIKEWNAATHLVTTLVSSGLIYPYGVAVDGSGNVYIADTDNNAIKEWSASTQQLITLVSSGLNTPVGVAVDGSGNVYIADKSSYAIREWSAATQQVTTLVSSGLASPFGVAVDGSGNVYIADTANNAIKEIPWAFVGPASLSEPRSAGSDSLLPVLPSTTSFAGIFAPTSDQNWLTIGTIANGAINFSFTTDLFIFGRTAHITVLGQQITVTQPAAPAVPALTVTKTHAGNFTQGQNGATYTVTVSNAGAAATSGTVTVTETAPPGLTLVSMGGRGWTCGHTSCARSEALAAGSSYEAITVTVNVAANASSPQVNAVSVSGGGSGSANTTDSTTIVSAGNIDLSNIGVFRSGMFALDLDQATYTYNANTTKFRYFGLPGDQPVAGDWLGTGVFSFGVFRAGAWYFDLNNNGQFDANEGPFFFGLPGDAAIVGDWTGSGSTKVGVFRCPASGVCTWYLSSATQTAATLVPNANLYNPATTLVYSYGLPGDQPVANNWSGTAKVDQIGVFRCPASGVCSWIVENVGDGVYRTSDPVYSFGLSGDIAVVGDWNDGNQRKRIGVFRSGLWILEVNGTNTYASNDLQASFGLPGDKPVVGKWTMP